MSRRRFGYHREPLALAIEGRGEWHADERAFRKLAVAVILDALKTHLNGRRGAKHGNADGPSAEVSIADARRFLFDREGEWAESRAWWLEALGLEPEVASALLRRYRSMSAKQAEAKLRELHNVLALEGRERPLGEGRRCARGHLVAGENAMPHRIRGVWRAQCRLCRQHQERTKRRPLMDPAARTRRANRTWRARIRAGLAKGPTPPWWRRGPDVPREGEGD